MGMAASQARLLSLTAHLTDNEMRSQMITNSKVRLADKSNEASAEYMKALNSKQIMFSSYNSDGERVYQEMTAGLINEYSPLKNQYGLINTKGQILVSSTDAANFAKSANVEEFLKYSGVPSAINPKYTEALNEIMGENSGVVIPAGQNAATYLNNSYINNLTSNTNNWLQGMNSALINSTSYNTWISNMNGATGWLPNMSMPSGVQGYWGNFLSSFSNPPQWNFGAPPSAPPNLSSLATAYNSSACYGSVKPNTDGIGHMEHNLAELIWRSIGLSNGTNTIQNSSKTITITAGSAINNNSVSLTNFETLKSSTAGTNLLNGLNSAKQYPVVNQVIQDIIDLYCDVVNYLHNTSGGVSSNTYDTTKLNPSRYTFTSNAPVSTPSALYTQWQGVYNQLANVNSTVQQQYQTALQQWNTQYNNFCYQVQNYVNNINKMQNILVQAIANIPKKEIPDTTAENYGWYNNLWFRMNGNEEKKSDVAHYEELDKNLEHNASWLKFALEHGVVTMEQVQFQDPDDEYTQMQPRTWESIIYTSAPDYKEQDDELAITKAEVKYNKTLREIQYKDKEYDQDLKKLDSEHSALQTEYESLKSVIQKNEERSFKTFS